MCDKKHGYLFPARNTVAALTNDLSTLFATTLVERACKKSNKCSDFYSLSTNGVSHKKSLP